ncbi:MAG: toll/interleukin-1 receptor domain-containing protein, partial [Candidatus Aminicenantes bacterium]|nr:toll/interleukin-1 receptor domain-containing protein [Candidatus Aminicenantes bacterium]
KSQVVNSLEEASLDVELVPWDDSSIDPGDTWKKEIEKALNYADIAILLVSVDFFKSKFINEYELPRIIERREKEGLLAIPIIVNECPWKGHHWIKEIHAVPSDDKTLKQLYKEGKAGTELKKLAEKIARKIDSSKSSSATPPAKIPGKNTIDHRNPFTDTQAIQDPGRFIGREAEMLRLRRMLEHGCVSLQGERKIGKSSVLLHLARNWTHSPVIGPLDLMGITDAEDFYGQLACKLGLPGCDRSQIRDALHSFIGIILLDELDYGPQKGIVSDDIGIFRAACQENRNLKIAAVSRQPLKTLFTENPGSWVFDFLQPLLIKGFTEEEARFLLTHP